MILALVASVAFGQWDAPPPGDAPPSDSPTPVPPAPPAETPPEAPKAEAPPPEKKQESSAAVSIGEGWRIAPMGAANGLRIGQESVVGRAGGTNATTVQARGTVGSTYLQVSVPFAAFRTPDERAADLGNVGFDLWRGKQRDSGYRAFGLEVTLPTGGRAWTWTNRPDDLWPNAGVDLAWQESRDLGGLTFIHRIATGLHTTRVSDGRAFEPIPAIWFRAQGAVALDAPIGERFGVTGELALQTWDTSPLELTGLFRGNVIEGLDARAGIVFPVGVWAGWTPSDQRAGISETTFLLDLTMSLL